MNIRTILLYSLLSFLVFMPDVHAQEPVDYVMFDKIRQEGLNRSPIGHEIPSKIGEPMRQNWSHTARSAPRLGVPRICMNRSINRLFLTQ